jgi:hypothetical protein
MPMRPHWSNAGTLLLAIAPEAWPPPSRGARMDGIDFAPKTELHVTIVGRALGAELRTAIAADPGLATAIDATLASLDWSWTRDRAWWLLRKREGATQKASIVETVALPAMQRFHARLGQLLGRTLPVPPPHVTLYVAGGPEGIGVPDDATWRRYVVRAVSADELPA